MFNCISRNNLAICQFISNTKVWTDASSGRLCTIKLHLPEDFLALYWCVFECAHDLSPKKNMNYKQKSSYIFKPKVFKKGKV